MPRIIVTAEPVSSRHSDDAPVLLDEQVQSVHLSSGHAASQLVERLAWAISDAEDAEDALAARRARRGRRPSVAARRPPPTRGRRSARRALDERGGVAANPVATPPPRSGTRRTHI